MERKEERKSGDRYWNLIPVEMGVSAKARDPRAVVRSCDRDVDLLSIAPVSGSRRNRSWPGGGPAEGTAIGRRDLFLM